MYNCHAILNNFGKGGGWKSRIHLAEVSVFAGMTGKNRHFRDLSQQVLLGVVTYSNLYLVVLASLWPVNNISSNCIVGLKEDI